MIPVILVILIAGRAGFKHTLRSSSRLRLALPSIIIPCFRGGWPLATKLADLFVGIALGAASVTGQTCHGLAFGGRLPGAVVYPIALLDPGHP